ncbi:HemK/PrmC family methyltransferase, partial [Arthrospira platensis SPKY1]|nr:HemK/PrmC family methyltransferase [Arthrospira platensis SPKY1]
MGNQPFHGLVLKTDARALIPRPETEELVEFALQQFPIEPSLRVVDVGSGSGCIALALKAKRPDWRIVGLDVSVEALSLAKENALQLGLDVPFLPFDLFAWKNWPKEKPMDLLISNPPYIENDEIQDMDTHVVAHEPQQALFT